MNWRDGSIVRVAPGFTSKLFLMVTPLGENILNELRDQCKGSEAGANSDAADFRQPKSLASQGCRERTIGSFS